LLKSAVLLLALKVEQSAGQLATHSVVVVQVTQFASSAKVLQSQA
jgi:hypothetical protein